MSAYGRQYWHGKLLDNATVSALKLVEGDLGYELTITQGIGGAAASAGTHAEGRAVDLAPYDWRNKLKALWRRGFIAWYRPYKKGVWPAHIHAVLVLFRFDNHDGIAESAWRQIGLFVRGLSGLVGNARSIHYPHPKITPFQYPPKQEVKPVFSNDITKARDFIVEAADLIGKAVSHLEAARDKDDKPRRVATAQAKVLRGFRAGLNGSLKIIPKR